MRRHPLLLLAVAATVGCGAGQQPQGPDAQAVDGAPELGDGAAADAPPGVFVACPGAEEPGPTGLDGDDMFREAMAGSIQVTAVFCNTLMPAPPDELLFYITLTNHLGLEPSDPTNPASGTSVTTGGDLRTDGPFTWVGSDLTVDDHHAKGHLHAPDRTGDGTPLLGPDTQYLELTLGGIGGDNVFVARWEREFLPALP